MDSSAKKREKLKNEKNEIEWEQDKEKEQTTQKKKTRKATAF